MNLAKNVKSLVPPEKITPRLNKNCFKSTLEINVKRKYIGLNYFYELYCENVCSFFFIQLSIIKALNYTLLAHIKSRSKNETKVRIEVSLLRLITD